jgi:flagellar protein FlaG
VPIQQDVMVKPLIGEKEAISELKKADLPVQAQQKTTEDSAQKLEVAVEQVNRTMETFNTKLRFAIHKGSGRVAVQVINSRDNSVIREIPSESVLNFAAHVKEMLGVLFDKFI